MYFKIISYSEEYRHQNWEISQIKVSDLFNTHHLFVLGIFYSGLTSQFCKKLKQKKILDKYYTEVDF